MSPKARTIGEMYGPAMAITDPDEAARYFTALVDEVAAGDPDLPRAHLAMLVKTNLGYYAGYYDDATRARVERLFGCAHPIFGAIATAGPPTAAQAFQAGLALGKKRRT